MNRDELDQELITDAAGDPRLCYRIFRMLDDPASLFEMLPEDQVQYMTVNTNSGKSTFRRAVVLSPLGEEFCAVLVCFLGARTKGISSQFFDMMKDHWSVPLGSAPISPASP